MTYLLSLLFIPDTVFPNSIYSMCLALFVLFVKQLKDYLSRLGDYYLFSKRTRRHKVFQINF